MRAAVRTPRRHPTATRLVARARRGPATASAPSATPTPNSPPRPSPGRNRNREIDVAARQRTQPGENREEDNRPGENPHPTESVGQDAGGGATDCRPDDAGQRKADDQQIEAVEAKSDRRDQNRLARIVTRSSAPRPHCRPDQRSSSPAVPTLAPRRNGSTWRWCPRPLPADVDPARHIRPSTSPGRRD